jgi:hypothetical protein
MEAWDLIKLIIQFAIYPVFAIVVWFMRKQYDRLDKVEVDLGKQITRTAVIESKVDDIRDDIKEIKRNVAKLVDRRK